MAGIAISTLNKFGELECMRLVGQIWAGEELSGGWRFAYPPYKDEVMATGWAPDGAVQGQIDDSITDEVMRARARLPHGEGAAFCLECGEEIPEKRRLALPGVKTCVACQAGIDEAPVNRGFNRRGSKDSQLK